MTLTADRAGTFFEVHDELEYLLPLGGGEDCGFIGSLVCSDASGYGIAATDTAGKKFEGVIINSDGADFSCDNTNGADGAITVTVKRKGRIKLTLGTGALTQASKGVLAYITDDETFDLAATTTNDVLMGYIDEIIDATHAWISFDVDALRLGGN